MTDHPTRANDNLLRKMWQTKSARFNGHVRLNRKHWMSIAATSMLSCYLVAISLYQLAYEKGLTAGTTKLLSVANLVVSVFLIMITLLEGARNYGKDAERMHENALAISKKYNAFQALTVDQANKQRDRFAREYSDLLIDTKLNHKDVDYNLFRIPNARELGIEGARYAGMIARTGLLLVAEYWLYFTLIFLPPIGFCLLLGEVNDAEPVPVPVVEATAP